MFGYGEEPAAEEVVTVDVVIEAEDVVEDVEDDTNGDAVVVRVADDTPADTPANIEFNNPDTEAAVSPTGPELVTGSITSFVTS